MPCLPEPPKLLLQWEVAGLCGQQGRQCNEESGKMSQYAALRANVGLLGTQLGDTVRNQLGSAVLERIEQIRSLAKQILILTRVKRKSQPYYGDTSVHRI